MDRVRDCIAALPGNLRFDVLPLLAAVWCGSIFMTIYHCWIVVGCI